MKYLLFKSSLSYMDCQQNSFSICLDRDLVIQNLFTRNVALFTLAALIEHVKLEFIDQKETHHRESHQHCSVSSMIKTNYSSDKLRLTFHISDSSFSENKIKCYQSAGLSSLGLSF